MIKKNTAVVEFWKWWYLFNDLVNLNEYVREKIWNIAYVGAKPTARKLHRLTVNDIDGESSNILEIWKNTCQIIIVVYSEMLERLDQMIGNNLYGDKFRFLVTARTIRKSKTVKTGMKLASTCLDLNIYTEMEEIIILQAIIF